MNESICKFTRLNVKDICIFCYPPFFWTNEIYQAGICKQIL